MLKFPAHRCDPAMSSSGEAVASDTGGDSSNGTASGADAPGCTPSPIEGYVCVLELDGSGVQMHWNIADVEVDGETSLADSAAEGVAKNASFLAVAPAESSGGWVALGFGTSMIGARVAIAFHDGASIGPSGGFFLCSEYSPDGVQLMDDADAAADGFQLGTLVASVQSFPVLVADGNGTSAAATETEPALSVAFSRVLSAAEEELATMVYATTSSWKNYHGTARGTFETNLQSGESTTLDVQSPLRNYWIAHGALMLVAWLFVAPASASAVRLLRPVAERGQWFTWVHRPGTLLTLFLTLAGFVIAAVKFDAGGINSAAFSHGAIGVAVFAMVCTQVLMGLGRPREKESTTRRCWYGAHAVLGVSTLGLALSNVVIGVNVICDLDGGSCDSWIVAASVIGFCGIFGMAVVWWLIARSVVARRAATKGDSIDEEKGDSETNGKQSAPNDAGQKGGLDDPSESSKDVVPNGSDVGK